MAGRLRLLGQRVLARHTAAPRVGGLRLAQHVVAARTPEKIVESSTRLARGRSIEARSPARTEEAAVPRPPGMSEFAARWIFGDGPPEGIPIAGEAALKELAPADKERPSFLVDRDQRVAREAEAAQAEVERRSQPVARGRVEEVTSFKLSRRPAPVPPVAAAETPAPPPETRSPPEAKTRSCAGGGAGGHAAAGYHGTSFRRGRPWPVPRRRRRRRRSRARSRRPSR